MKKMKNREPRRGEYPQRFRRSTLDKLDEIRRRSLKHYGSYDELIAELADARLSKSGIPLLSEKAAARVRATGALRTPRSSTSDDVTNLADHKRRAVQ